MTAQAYPLPLNTKPKSTALMVIDKTVSGKVSDSADGQGIPGVTYNYF
jgi:hypothetical protein